MRIHRIQGIVAYSHLIEADDGLVLVDAGTPGHSATILRRIASLGRSPSELRLAVITHGHADHFGGLARLRDVADFDVLVHPAHACAVERGETIVSPGLNPFSRAYEAIARGYLPLSRMRGAGAVIPAENGLRLDAYGVPGRILYTPGHSEGCMSLLLDDGTAFVGDLVQGRRIPRITPPEFPNMALDQAQVAESWQMLLDAGATVIYPAHGSVVTAEEVARVLERAKRSRSSSHGVRA